MTPPLPLSLIRIEQNDYATFGLLQDAEHKKICVTLEPPWKNNQHKISCIPAGTYTAKRRNSVKHHGIVFGIEGVPDRSDIEIHIGNFPHDTEGCVLLGEKYGTLDEEKCVLESGTAFKRFMAAMEGVDEFMLDVMNPFPVAA